MYSFAISHCLFFSSSSFLGHQFNALKFEICFSFSSILLSVLLLVLHECEWDSLPNHSFILRENQVS